MPRSSGAVWIDPGWRQTVGRQTVRYDDQGLSTSVYEFEFVAQDERGARAIAQRVFDYNSYFSTFELSNAETVKSDGQIVAVDPQAIRDQPSQTDPGSPYFDEYRNRIVSFPNVQIGDRVRGRIIETEIRASIEGQIARSWEQSLTQPPGTFDLTVDLPISRSVHVFARNAEHSMQRSGERVIHHVVLRHEVALPRSIDVDEAGKTSVFEISTYDDYQAFAAAMSARNTPQSVPDDTIRKMAAEIVGEATTSREKAKRIYSWVARNIRYVGIGLKDGGFTSQPAASVLAARYGDCKAHVSVLKALLAAQGIKLDFVLINADGQFSLTTLATPNFNHAIGYLPELDLYVDPTAALVAFGELPAPLYGKPVLNIDTGSLARIPEMQPADFVLGTVTELTLQDDGTRHGQSTFFGSGVGAAIRRSTAWWLENQDRQLLAETKLRSYEFEGNGDYQFPNPRDLTTEFSITAPMNILTRLDLTTNKRIRMVPFTSFGDALSEKTSGNVRGRNFYCRPIDYRETVSLRLPQGIRPAELPKSFALNRAFGGQTAFGNVQGRIDMELRATFEQGVIRADRHVTVNFSHSICPARFGLELDAAFGKWDEQRWLQVVLTRNPVSEPIESGSELSNGIKAYDAQNYATAVETLKPLAQSGSAEAQFYMGLMAHDGRGLGHDDAIAVSWFRQAAIQGNARAQMFLALSYRDGKGVPVDMVTALDWLKKSAAGGYVEAQYLLGWMYRNGRGVERDFSEAAKWFERGAEQQNSRSLDGLGGMYAFGQGVPPDLKKACGLFQRAALGGETVSAYNLGWCYESGQGLERDPKLAREWYIKAANQGNVAAKSRLSIMDTTGATRFFLELRALALGMP